MRLTVQGRRRSAAIATAGMAAMIGSVVLAGPASAHTPNWSVTCDSVTVDLTAYNSDVRNTVTLTIVGGEGALVDQTFGSAFHFQDALPPHDAPLDLHLVVTAGDGKKFGRDETKTAPVCVKPSSPSPSTTSPTSPSTTAATTAPATTAPATTPPTTAAPSTSPAPVVASTTSAGGGDLAETGSSNATPMIAGIAVAVVAAGGGLVFWTRRRGSSSHR
ncbi:LPXTG cell wall anchor domain-containing protein [Streptomyces cocklensis]|uniref:LPXTG-motif cell wall anchor domain-containing protein n=1 Tax=Actinacidiphila cocklensis TaxID=887465 RepID=A0A9W4GX04_9ACTN|nr:LAETG motif-containing sortase-dependent surface protein [Actinacidiphila cocklensis]MDD1059060.1 LPXTG cell wall anchor domain-containing protein [Actinacidiphila cocklensis]CAG6398260.1 LPXTG-motif cell wall anchor domain-containing protein [Actinacidiphila cocklensis]